MKSKTLTSILLASAFSGLIVAVTAQAGTLIVSYEPVAAVSDVNLTALNATDWTQYGNGGFPGIERKSGVAPANQLPDFIQIPGSDSGYWGDFGGTPNTYVWSDGAPTASAAKANGIYVGSLGGGFGFDIPASTVPQTFRVWHGAYESTALVEVWLSDGSAPGFTNNSYSNLDGPNRVLSLTFAANSAGQTNHVRITTTANDGGNITLQAAALCPVEPVIALNTLFSGQIHANASLGLGFTASTVSPLTIPNTAIYLTLNGQDVSSQLTFGGTASAPTATYVLRTNKFYSGQMIAVQSNGRGVTNAISFDTFTYGDTNTGIVIDAEDYNYTNGMYMYPADVSQFAGKIGTLGTDYNFTGTRVGDFYREGNGTGHMDAYGAMPYEQGHSANNDYFIRGMLSGDYLNYTRNFKAGRYQVMVRLANQPRDANVTELKLSHVADATLAGSSQVLTDIATLVLPNGQSDNFFFSRAMTNGAGQPLEITLTEGVHSFRVTRSDTSAANDESIRLNFFGFSRISPVAPIPPLVTIATSGPNVNVAFPTAAGFTYTLQYKNSLSDAIWQDILPTVAGDGSTKTVTQPSSGTARFYRVSVN